MVLTIWFALRKYPKRLTLYYEGSKPFTSHYLPNLKSVEIDSKNISIDPNKSYYITTLFLQNTGPKDFKMEDFQDGIKINFTKYKVLDVRHVDYPEHVNSSHILRNSSQIDVKFKVFKKKEIIRYDILGEISERTSIAHDISFHCRGVEISKGKIERVSNRLSIDLLGEVMMSTILIVLMTILLCFPMGYIAPKPQYQVFEYANRKDTGIIKYYSKDSIAFYDLRENEIIEANIPVNTDKFLSIIEYKRKEFSIMIKITTFMFPAIMCILLFSQIKAYRLKKRLEKVV